MNNKSIKLADLIFLTICGILLLIPCCKIDFSKKIYGGKTYLKDFPSLYKKNNFNLNIGQDFDAWLGSRFFTKNELKKIYNMFSCSMNINYCINGYKVFDKKNSVIYQKTFWGYQKDNRAEIANSIQELNNWCKKRNIKLYILIIPSRANFIKYNTPNKKLKFSEDSAEKIVKYAKTHTDANIIFPYDELKTANKKSLVYFKTDHHWTQTGAYIGYRALMEEIKKDFPEIFILNENNLTTSKNKLVKGLFDRKYDGGSMLKYSGFPEFYEKKLLTEDYLYYTTPLKSNLKITNQSDLPYFNSETDYIFSYNGENKRRAILIGDSFTSNLSVFLPYSFREVVSLLDNYRRFNFKEYEKIITVYEPDIIIVNMRTAWIDIFNNF